MAGLRRPVVSIGGGRGRKSATANRAVTNGSASQPSVQEFKTEGAKYGLTPEDLNDLNVATGWNFGAYLTQLLKASPELERSKVMNTAWFQDGVKFGMNLDGITWSTNGAEDPYGYQQLQFVTRTGGKWVPQGEITDYGSQLQQQESGG